MRSHRPPHSSQYFGSRVMKTGSRSMILLDFAGRGRPAYVRKQKALPPGTGSPEAGLVSVTTTCGAI